LRTQTSAAANAFKVMIDLRDGVCCLFIELRVPSRNMFVYELHDSSQLSISITDFPSPFVLSSEDILKISVFALDANLLGNTSIG
jgi:hypothetical protein